jgi:hypothetical protein
VIRGSSSCTLITTVFANDGTCHIERRAKITSERTAQCDIFKWLANIAPSPTPRPRSFVNMSMVETKGDLERRRRWGGERE